MSKNTRERWTPVQVSFYEDDADFFIEAKNRFCNELGFDITNKQFMLFLMKRYREEDPEVHVKYVQRLNKKEGP